MRTYKGSSYRRRRFKCEDCGYTEMVYADGGRDIAQYDKVLKEIDYKLEEEKLKREQEKNE